MASILKKKNAGKGRREPRYQWISHCGHRARARNLKRLQAEALREQRASCDWLTVTTSVPVPDADASVPDVR